MYIPASVFFFLALIFLDDVARVATSKQEMK